MSGSVGAAREREVVVVAGASGYVGGALGSVLSRRYALRGLSRRERAPTANYPEWRVADLFSLADAEAALAGADRAVYLVHSMQPRDRLTQGRFEDLDLICADNFGRAAKRAGIKQIVYLGGLVPRGAEARGELSRHLESRLETERALGAHGVPVTALRAGLVIGRGGSSFQILERLVRRLPVMACPRWTRTETQPIAVDDVTAAIDASLGRDDLDGAYDIGGPDVLSYSELMRRTAAALGKRRPMIAVPLLTVGLSRLWVSLVTGAPKELVQPLIQSLVHPMVAGDNALRDVLGVEATPLDEALARALRPEPEASSSSASTSSTSAAARSSGRRSRVSTVKSAQRMVVSPGRDAAWVAQEYMRWLPDALWPLLEVTRDGPHTYFRARGLRAPLLVLRLAPERSGRDRQLFYVVGGALADVESSPRARLEFRQVLGGDQLIAAIHDFAPRLPWLLYRWTQALIHLVVMRLFGGHLRRLSEAPIEALEQPEAAPLRSRARR